MAAVLDKVFKADFKSLKKDGTGSAVFATMGVVDKDGDLTQAGAFGKQTVKLVGGHNWEVPNIGMAKIYEKGDEAIADFQFYLDMPSAKEWYTAVRKNFENGIEQEYSYGFRIRKQERRDVDGKKVRHLLDLKVFEVSFVMSGAGEGTRTLGIKGENRNSETSPVQEKEKTPTETPKTPVKSEETVKNLDLQALDASFEDWQQKLYREARKQFLPANPDDYMPWISLLATYDSKCYVRVETRDKAGYVSKYYELLWTKEEDNKVRITDQREVKFEVSVRDAEPTSVAVMRHAVGHAKHVFEGMKAGRVLSAANRTRLSNLLSSLQEMDSLRGSVIADISSFLDETDPDKEKNQAVVELASLLSEAAVAKASAALSQ